MKKSLNPNPARLTEQQCVPQPDNWEGVMNRGPLSTQEPEQRHPTHDPEAQQRHLDFPALPHCKETDRSPVALQKKLLLSEASSTLHFKALFASWEFSTKEDSSLSINRWQKLKPGFNCCPMTSFSFLDGTYLSEPEYVQSNTRFKATFGADFSNCDGKKL